MKLKYEVMARNELNQKLSEVNTFLDGRAKSQEVEDKSREESMQKIQKDLGQRLDQSKSELSTIKAQMKGMLID